jgi:integrase
MRGLYKRGSIWWCSYKSITGIVRQSTGKSDYNEAMEFLGKRVAEVRAEQYPELKKISNHKFKELAVQYRPWCQRQRGVDGKNRYINQLVEEFGEIPLRQFSTMLVEQFQTKRLQRGAPRKKVKKGPEGKLIVVKTDTIPAPNKPATINRLVATLKHMFTKAVEWEMVEEEVLKKVRKVKMLPENNRRLRYLSVEECQRLIDNCRGSARSMVIMALNTGMRRGEIFSLTWDQVDLKHGFILLDRTKNGERREIPINDMLRQMLQALPRRIDGGRVFSNPETGESYQTLSSVFIRACRLAGITDFRFHDLRHTFASHLVMAGVDITTVKELLSHKTLAMTLRYAHLAPSHKVKALEILNKTLNGTSTSQLLHNGGF